MLSNRACPSWLTFPLLAFFGATAGQAATLLATEDNVILKSAPDAVQSASSATLPTKVANSAQSNSRTIYMKFDASTVSSAVDGTQATLNVTTTAAAETNFTLQLYALNSGVTGYNWTESGITWNNAPGANTGSSGTNYMNTANATALGSPYVLASGTAAGTVSFAFTNWQNYVQQDGSLTLILVTTAQTSGTPTLNFASSENTTLANPSLAITPIPEPASAALVALGAVAVVAVRRRAYA